MSINRLLRIIIFPIDDDIITGLVKEDKPGVSKSLGTAVSWFTNRIENILQRKREEMYEICMGSLVHNEPKLMWIKAINRPRAKESAQVLIEKYNDILEETLASRHLSYIISLEDVITANHLDRKGDLTIEGRIVFWKFIDQMVHQFDKHEVKLKPRRVITESRSLQQSKESKKKSNYRH